MKKLLTAVAAVAAATVIWLMMSGSGVSGPDPVTAPTEDVRKFIASKAFGGQDEAVRAEYMAKIRELPDERRREVFSREGLSEEESRAVRRNLRGTRRTGMLEEATKFFELSPEEQVAHLDKRIDETAARRKAWEERRAASQNTERTGNEGRRGRRPRSADQMQKWMERRLSQHTPRERAVFHEYFRRLRERRRQRGG